MLGGGIRLPVPMLTLSGQGCVSFTTAIPLFVKVKNSSPKNCRPTVIYCLLSKSSANSRPTVGSMSLICLPSVGWEPLSNIRKALVHREEHSISTQNEIFSLESAILFRFLGRNSHNVWIFVLFSSWKGLQKIILICKVIFYDVIFVSSNGKASFLWYFDTTLNL